MLFINIAPPSLCVADKVDFWKFLQRAMEAVEVQVVRAMLEMHQDRHSKFLRYLGHRPYILGIAGRGLEEAVTERPELLSGLNTINGSVCHPGVAKALGVPPRHPMACLR